MFFRIMATFFNSQYRPVVLPGEINSGPSVTVPNQAYSIRELFQRAISGTMPAIVKQGFYENEFENPDLSEVPERRLDYDFLDAFSDRVALENSLRNSGAYSPKEKREKGGEGSTSEPSVNEDKKE